MKYTEEDVKALRLEVSGVHAAPAYESPSMASACSIREVAELINAALNRERTTSGAKG